MRNEVAFAQEEHHRQRMQQEQQVMQYNAQLLAQAMQYYNANQV